MEADWQVFGCLWQLHGCLLQKGHVEMGTLGTVIKLSVIRALH